MKGAELAVRIAFHEILRIVPKFVGAIPQRRLPALGFRVDLDNAVAHDVGDAAPPALRFECLGEDIQIHIIFDVEGDVSGVAALHPRRELGKRIVYVGIEFGVPEMDQFHRGVANGR